MALMPLDLPRFEVRADSGTVVLRDGFVVTFFLPLSHRDAAGGVRSAVESYFQMPEMPATVWLLDREGLPRPHDASQARVVIDDVLRERSDECDLWAADMGDGAPRFRVRYHGLDRMRRIEEGWPMAISGVSFSFPTDYLGDAGLLEVFDFANRIAGKLPFSYGLVSPAFLNAEGTLESAAFAALRGLSRRYCCLEVPALLADCFELGDSPKGAYWGSYYGASLLQRLGGEPGVRAAFAGTEVRFESFESSALSVYVDQLPISGDVNRREDVSKYQREFRVVHRLLAPRRVPYMNFDSETFEEWIYRFGETLRP